MTDLDFALNNMRQYLKEKGIQCYTAPDIEHCTVRVHLRLDDLVTELRFRREDLQHLDYVTKLIEEACDLLLKSKAQLLHTS